MLAARLVATFHLRSSVPRWLLAPLAALALSACGGSGGDNDSPPPAGGTVTISGKITFERVPFKAPPGEGLNFSATVDQPARGVVVEALNGSTGAVLASTTTNVTGDYSVQVPAGQSVRMRAKAQMLSTAAPTMNFRILDNTNGNALYTLDGTASSSGTTDSTRNLRAPSRWGGASYTGTRAAAPFAILDTVYKAKELVIAASASAAFPALDLYWSGDNKTTSGCTDTGDIGTSFYTPGAINVGNCTQTGAVAGGIYILGFLGGGDGDTDEFDQHVIAHEFGHYIEDQFGRSDSIGGDHSDLDRLDLRVAFGEGWGDAYSGMVLNDPVYRDSSGINADNVFADMELGSTDVDGWFSEASVREILWDVFDAAADGGESVALGFAPIFAVMTNEQRTTDAFTSIYSFVTALSDNNPAQASGIAALLTGEDIVAADEFGTSETNAGFSSNALPIYRDVTIGQPLPTLCTTRLNGDYNKLDNRRFLRLTLINGGTVTITAAGTAGSSGGAATDPDIIVWRRGADLGLDGEDEPIEEPVEAINQAQLAAGTYVIEVYDYDLLIKTNTASCMTVSVTGTGN